ncbi:MAG: 30S ribosomal protein S15 [Leptospiraceae bacterium]|nr:30S ribosomal protein S15 [Leptospiraceae bacterium]
MITTEQKQNIINDYKVNEKDTGSSEVQIALIHNRILDLNIHFSKNKKDFHSRRGLLQLVSQRKRLLDYLKRKDINSYRELIKKLGIRK